MPSLNIPFLTTYDPPGSSEGTLDPLGLYQIADRLAAKLVPAVRERMQRIRFLTAMAVGAYLTSEIDPDLEHPETPPFIVWEWLVIEAIIRSMDQKGGLWGIPGTRVTRRALGEHNYLDLRSYLKTPRIFGFHGVYKRLAVHLGLLDVHLGPGPKCEQLIDAWARDSGYGNLSGVRQLLDKWQSAVIRSMSQKPPKTRTGWNHKDWAELYELLEPGGGKKKEKEFLQNLLLAADERKLEALPAIWQLQDEFSNDQYREERVHDRLKQEEPSYTALLEAIEAYEKFSRCLTDTFDIIRSEAGTADAGGFEINALGQDEDAVSSLEDLNLRYDQTYHRLGEIDLQVMNLFSERFSAFAEPMKAAEGAAAVCELHEQVQRGKSIEGKRPWFDRISKDRIYMRQPYRKPRRPIEPDHYVHDYRGKPIRNFYFDLK